VACTAGGATEMGAGIAGRGGSAAIALDDVPGIGSEAMAAIWPCWAARVDSSRCNVVAAALSCAASFEEAEAGDAATSAAPVRGATQASAPTPPMATAAETANGVARRRLARRRLARSSASQRRSVIATPTVPARGPRGSRGHARLGPELSRLLADSGFIG